MRTGAKAMGSAVLAAAWALAVASGVGHAAPRTFVATWGNDAWPCTRAQPCRNFQPAIAAVDAGGEVAPLDSGSYGDMFINKSLSIVVPEGVHAGVTVQGNYGILVTVTAADRVLLQGLALNVLPPGNHGVVFNSPGTLEIQSLTINSPAVGSGAGIWVNGYFDGLQAGRRVVIANTDIRGFAHGIDVGDPNYPVGWLEMELHESSIVDAGGVGLNFLDFNWTEYVSIRGSTVAASGGAGAWIEANDAVGNGDSTVVIEDSMFVFNGAEGLRVAGKGRPRTTISGIVASGNQRALSFSDYATGRPVGFTRQDNTAVFEKAPYTGGMVVEPGK